ncbi:hypothetical protein [Bradyrhizobium brasilense]|uniref:hypothetical protein n=1 Tax=Bradyrhizobium brasilense TaxID=1419277 RepID=UPI0014567929|nr:hypothetical protein [Bradyrhizobium brasilense]
MIERYDPDTRQDVMRNAPKQTFACLDARPATVDELRFRAYDGLAGVLAIAACGGRAQ